MRWLICSLSTTILIPPVAVFHPNLSYDCWKRTMHLSSLLFLFFSFSSSRIVPSSTKEYRYLIFWLSNFICRLTNRQLTTPVYLISLIILFYSWRILDFYCSCLCDWLLWPPFSFIQSDREVWDNNVTFSVDSSLSGARRTMPLNRTERRITRIKNPYYRSTLWRFIRCLWRY